MFSYVYHFLHKMIQHSEQLPVLLVGKVNGDLAESVKSTDPCCLVEFKRCPLRATITPLIRHVAVGEGHCWVVMWHMAKGRTASDLKAFYVVRLFSKHLKAGYPRHISSQPLEIRFISVIAHHDLVLFVQSRLAMVQHFGEYWSLFLLLSYMKGSILSQLGRCNEWSSVQLR